MKTAEGALPAALRAAAHQVGAEKEGFGLPQASEGPSSRHCDQLVLLQAVAGCRRPSTSRSESAGDDAWLPRRHDVRAKRRQHL